MLSFLSRTYTPFFFFPPGCVAPCALQGDRSLSALKAHAKALTAPCSLDRVEDSCTPAQQRLIASFRALPAAELANRIEAGKAAMVEAEEAFEAGVKELQAKRKALGEVKDAAKARVKNEGGLGNARAVMAVKRKAGEA